MPAQADGVARNDNSPAPLDPRPNRLDDLGRQVAKLEKLRQNKYIDLGQISGFEAINLNGSDALGLPECIHDGIRAKPIEIDADLRTRTIYYGGLLAGA